MRHDAAAFEALYARHAADVFRFALYLTGDRAEAEEVTAETFARLWTSPRPIRTETVKAYLLAIARNVHLHDRRRQRRHAALPAEVADARAAPDVVAERLAELDAVRAKLATLPEIDRAALLMSSIEGVPYADVAVALGISLASVKIKIHRARLALASIRTG